MVEEYASIMKNVLEKKDRRAITINTKQDANIKIHYKKDTDITWYTQDGLHPLKKFQFLLLYHPTK